MRFKPIGFIGRKLRPLKPRRKEEGSEVLGIAFRSVGDYWIGMGGAEEGPEAWEASSRNDGNIRTNHCTGNQPD